MGVLPKLFKLWPWVDLDPFYAKVKFGHIGFCIRKSENYFFFGNYCSLMSQSCLMHSTKWVSKVKVILWFWSKVTQISKLNFNFGLYTQVSHSGPQGPLVLPIFCQKNAVYKGHEFCIPFNGGQLLTHCILVDSSTLICWTSPFVSKRVLGLFCRFYSILDAKSC